MPVRASQSMPAAIKRQASACGSGSAAAAAAAASAAAASNLPNLLAIDKRVPHSGSLCRRSPRRQEEAGSTAAAAVAAARAWAEREVTKVVISVACCDLPCTGVFAVISLLGSSFATDKSSVATETVEDTASPMFAVSLISGYRFEERQTVHVEVFAAEASRSPEAAAAAAAECLPDFPEDLESPSASAAPIVPPERSQQRQHLIGHCSVSLGRVIHCGGRVTCPLSCSSAQAKPATCSIKVEEYEGNKETLQLALRGRGLDKKDLFGKSDPYVLLHRRSDKGRLMRSYRTEVVKNTLDPDWRPIKVSVDRLCGGDLRREIMFRCFDWDGADGDPEDMDIEFDEFIGEFSTTMEDLLAGGQNSELQFDLVNPKKARKKKNYRNSGVISVKASQVDFQPSFLDYLFSGMDLCFTVAIDMTASNGVASQPTSLHYTDPFTPNQYTTAMQAVLEIIQDYDTDQLLPAFGFGCRVPPDFRVSHEWPLNGDSENPYCEGADGVLAAYRRCLEQVRLSGPTNFAPVIRSVSRLAQERQDGSSYMVLLILTDGTIDDWIECKRAVIEASFLPVSIIVIGVGNGDFTEMELLDQDVWLLEEGNQKACRDIVQFVELRRYLRPAADGTDSVRWSKVALTKDVLQELPAQITEYMQRRRLRPSATAARQAAAAAAGPLWQMSVDRSSD